MDMFCIYLHRIHCPPFPFPTSVPSCLRSRCQSHLRLDRRWCRSRFQYAPGHLGDCQLLSISNTKGLAYHPVAQSASREVL